MSRKRRELKIETHQCVALSSPLRGQKDNSSVKEDNAVNTRALAKATCRNLSGETLALTHGSFSHVTPFIQPGSRVVSEPSVTGQGCGISSDQARVRGFAKIPPLTLLTRKAYQNPYGVRDPYGRSRGSKE